MTLDQTFQTFLKEDNTNKTIPSSGNILVGLDQGEQEHLLAIMNSMLSAISDSPVINPYYIVERIKTRLKVTFGLIFDNAYFLGNIGSFERPLMAYNGLESTYGGGMTPPADNSWQKFFPHGLVIKFQFLKVGTLYNVNADIVPQPDPPKPPPISEN